MAATSLYIHGCVEKQRQKKTAQIEQLGTCVRYWSSCRCRKEAKTRNKEQDKHRSGHHTDMAGEEERGVVRVKVKVGSCSIMKTGLLLACPLSSWCVRALCCVVVVFFFPRLTLVVLPAKWAAGAGQRRDRVSAGRQRSNPPVGHIDVSILSFVVTF